MHLSRLLIPLLLGMAIALQAQPKIQLVDFASGFVRPLDLTHAGDNRLFVVEQRGLIWALDSLGNRLDTFLNINARVRDNGNEQGLLGLAFHPNYAQNGWFYVNYTREPDGDTRIARFSRRPNNPNEADPDSEVILLTIDQPFANHNGGGMKFGPDGYLYCSLGDGGSGGDPQNNGQKKNSLLGKILRLDVNVDSAAQLYKIPTDNPFVNDPAFRPEIWSWGLRNAWRFSFDRLTGDMWIADVGQNEIEEIDFEPAGTGGRNYGWRCYEGSEPYNTNGCLPASNYTPPVFEYNHSLGCSVTGGFVYRGSQYPDLYGKYLFTDYCTGRWWVVDQNAGGAFSGTQIANLADNQYSSLGEDIHGELFVMALAQGRIYKLRELCSSFQVNGTVANATCIDSNDGAVALTIAGGLTPVTVQWSTGATNTNSLINLAPGNYIAVAQDGNGCVRRDTFAVGHGSPAAPPITVIQGQAVLCAGDTAVLQVPPAPTGYGYQWYGIDSLPIAGAAAQELFVESSGIFYARYVPNDTAACASALSAPFVVDQEFALTPSIQYADTALITNSGWAAYQWWMNGEPVAGATDTFFLNLQAGANYQVVVTSTNGCQYTSEPFVIFNTHLPSNVELFQLAPNPTEDLIRLELRLQHPERLEIMLTDVQQRRLFYQTRQGAYITQTIDLRALPPAVYFLTVRLPNDQFTRQVVKQ